MKKNFKSEIYLLLIALIWGTGFIATKIASDNGMKTYNLLFFRFFISTILLYSLVKYKKIKVKRNDYLVGILLGSILVSGYAFQTFGILYTTPAKNALLTGLNVIFVPYISYGFFKTKIDRYTFIASILAFIGMYMLSGNFLSSIDNFNKGDFYTVLCAISFALHIVITGYFGRKINFISLSYIQFLVATIQTLILSIYYGHFEIINIVAFSNSLYLGIFCTFICYTLQIYAQRNISSSKTAILLSMEVVFATILSIFLGYDKFNYIILLGSVFIFLGIVISETKLKFK